MMVKTERKYHKQGNYYCKHYQALSNILKHDLINNMLHYYMFLVIFIQDEDDTSEYEESEGDELNKRKRKDSDEERKHGEWG